MTRLGRNFTERELKLIVIMLMKFPEALGEAASIESGGLKHVLVLQVCPWGAEGAERCVLRCPYILEA